MTDQNIKTHKLNNIRHTFSHRPPTPSSARNRHTVSPDAREHRVKDYHLEERKQRVNRLYYGLCYETRCFPAVRGGFCFVLLLLLLVFLLQHFVQYRHVEAVL